MTEELRSYLELGYSNIHDKGEEEDDKLNELTFNAELPWEFDENTLDNDHEFKTFEFDNEYNDENEIKLNSNLICANDKSSEDLLGLTGSLINFGIFKSTAPNRDGEDEDFAIAFNKLDMVDNSLSNFTESVCETSTQISNNIHFQESEFPHSFNDVPSESPMIALTNYSEELNLQFQQLQKADNLHALNQLVSNHINMLSNKAQVLGLNVDILRHVSYFRKIMSFVAIDNKLTEIQTKFASNPAQLNMEIAQIIQQFSLQPRQQQMELCLAHPFYYNLMQMLAAQTAAHASTQMKYHQSPVYNDAVLPEWASNEDKRNHEIYQNRCRNFDLNEGGWMSESERDWLTKIQTRNLVTDNPYVHDYYYTKMKLKELAETRTQQILKTGRTTISDPLSLLPSPITGEQLGAGIDPNKDGLCPGLKPIQFEKSLGMLSPSNLNTPRQIIQLPSRSVTTNMSLTNCDPSYKSIRSQRELLGLIEKMYSVVLRIDEVDKSLARMLVEQHKSRGVLVQHRHHLLKMLVDCVTSNDRFVDLLSVSKGARVVISTIAIVTSAQFVMILRTVFYNCISVCESTYFPQIESDMRSIVCSRIRNLKTDELTTILTIFYSNMTPDSLNDNSGRLQPLARFCSNEFGLYIILTTLDSYLKTNTNNKAHVVQLLSITIKSTESHPSLLKSMKEFKYLFPSMERQ